MKKLTILLAAGAIYAASSAFGQFSVTGTGANTIDFNTFTGSGFSPTPAAGQLNSNTWATSGWSDGSVAFGGTGTSGDFARGTSTGSVTTGGVYAFEVATGDFGLGVQPGGSDFTPGDFTFALTNNTGNTIISFAVSYDVYIFNDQNRGNSFNFSHSPDDTSYTDVPSADVTSPAAEDLSPVWVSTPESFTISGLTLLDGENYFFRWTGEDVDGSGSRDEFALDNLSFTAGVVPEPSTYAAIGGLVAFAVVMLRRRARK